MSPDMWEKYPDFFERFKMVWTSCPGRSLGAGYSFAAKWLNENSDYYERILDTCDTRGAKEDKRTWPPRLHK